MQKCLDDTALNIRSNKTSQLITCFMNHDPGNALANDSFEVWGTNVLLVHAVLVTPTPVHMWVCGRDRTHEWRRHAVDDEIMMPKPELAHLVPAINFHAKCQKFIRDRMVQGDLPKPLALTR